MHAIQVENLVMDYAGQRAVDGISFAVKAGTITALLGGNGAGKTTTLSILLGLLIPTTGEVKVLGHDMRHNRYAALAAMNFSSPYVDLPHRLTVEEILTIYTHLYNVPHGKTRMAELAEALALKDLMKKSYGQLSAGQQTRASLAKSLINSPRLLLLDEPTASLDPDTADWVRNYLRNYQRAAGATIFLASHNMQEVERLCDHAFILKKGQIVAQNSPQGLIETYGRRTLEDVFLHIARSGSEGAHVS